MSPAAVDLDTPSSPSRPPSLVAPASNLYRIDMHTHIMPRTLPDLAALTQAPGLGEKPYQWPSFHPVCTSGINSTQTDTDTDTDTEGDIDMYIGTTFFRRVTPTCYSPLARLSEMNTSGVDIQVLSTVPILFCYDAPLLPAILLAQTLNDHISSICTEYPDRFVGLGTVPLQDTSAAVDELRRVMRMPGMKGIQIGTSISNTIMLDDTSLEPFWQACQDQNCPVFIHPLGYALTRENPARWASYWASWLVGMPSETALAMHALTMGGVLARYPGLRICFAHGGGAFPGLLGRIQHGFACRPDLVAHKSAGISPTEYFGGGDSECGEEKGQIWIDSLVHDPDLLEYVIRKMGGTDRIVLGSDYPFPLGEVPVAGRMLTEDQRVREFMSWEDRAGVLAKNAIRFLNLGKEFEERFESRLREVETFSSVSGSNESLDREGGWDCWSCPEEKLGNGKLHVGNGKLGRGVKVVDSDWESSVSGSS